MRAIWAPSTEPNHPLNGVQVSLEPHKPTNQRSPRSPLPLTCTSLASPADRPPNPSRHTSLSPQNPSKQSKARSTPPLTHRFHLRLLSRPSRRLLRPPLPLPTSDAPLSPPPPALLLSSPHGDSRFASFSLASFHLYKADSPVFSTVEIGVVRLLWDVLEAFCWFACEEGFVIEHWAGLIVECSVFLVPILVLWDCGCDFLVWGGWLGCLRRVMFELGLRRVAVGGLGVLMYRGWRLGGNVLRRAAD